MGKFEHVPSVFRAARAGLSESLSAFEFFDTNSVMAVKQAMPALLSRMRDEDLPTSTSNVEGGVSGEIGLLIECSSSANVLDDRVARFVAPLVEQGILLSAICSQSTSHEQQLWKIRENIPTSLMQQSRSLAGEGGAVKGRLLKYDVSLTLVEMNEVVAELKNVLRAKGYFVDGVISTPCSDIGNKDSLRADFCCFGHGGDLNLHLNVLIQPDYLVGCIDPEHEIVQLKALLDQAVLVAVVARRGSLSAEHGVGQMKRGLMQFARSEDELSLMRSIKQLFDPKGILNPGKLFP